MLPRSKLTIRWQCLFNIRTTWIFAILQNGKERQAVSCHTWQYPLPKPQFHCQQVITKKSEIVSFYAFSFVFCFRGFSCQELALNQMVLCFAQSHCSGHSICVALRCHHYKWKTSNCIFCFNRSIDNPLPLYPSIQFKFSFSLYNFWKQLLSTAIVFQQTRAEHCNRLSFVFL